MTTINILYYHIFGFEILQKIQTILITLPSQYTIILFRIKIFRHILHNRFRCCIAIAFNVWLIDYDTKFTFTPAKPSNIHCCFRK